MSAPDEDDLTAAEYVLGTLSAPERRAAKARLEVDGAFAARVQDWEVRLAPLNATYPEAAPPDLLPAIEARLFPAPPRGKRGLGWLAGALAAGALAAVLIVALGLADLGRAPLPMAPAAGLRAELNGEEAQGATPVAFVALQTEQGLELRQSAGPAAPEGRVYQAWAIGGDGVPLSLGLLDAPALRVAFEGTQGLVLAISLEPAGGAPGPAPTGPVLASGVLN
jgi:anti-sigma-K factor RskA